MCSHYCLRLLQNLRNLQLVVTRGGGSVGTIAVDYSIVYLPLGRSDPSQGTTGVVAPAMGSIQIPEGQMSLQFNVPLMSDAFLEEGSAFYVTLDNTTLVGGGKRETNRLACSTHGSLSNMA